LQELTFQKQRILAELAQSLGDTNLRGLRFRMGAIT
jgi:hypothetical protein